MRTITLSLALAGALVLTGCTQVLSLNPVVEEGEASLDPALPGIWTEKDGGDTILVRQAGNAGYEVRFTGDEVAKFEARLLRIGEARLLDLVPKGDRPFHIPAHFLVRIWPEGNTLRWAFLDSDWLKNQIAEQRLPAQKSGDQLLLTVRTGALRASLLKLAADDRACGKVEVLQRAM